MNQETCLVNAAGAFSETESEKKRCGEEARGHGALKRALLRTLAISVGLDLLGCQTWRRGNHKEERGEPPLLQGEGRD